ncbi:MAG: ribosomal protein large subunit ribosomal protein [Candidatus Parcubacteria bacterium]|jgi:large subunit ribosomal protein L20
MRIKRGVTASKRRKNLLQHAKGFKWRRKTNFRAAKEALLHAWSYSYRDRRNKKRDKRVLWQAKINAASRANGIAYSRFINNLSKAKVELDRKSLAYLAEQKPEVFSQIVESTK